MVRSIGQLHQEGEGRWVVAGPERCANGHDLTVPESVWVRGSQARIEWECRQCGDITATADEPSWDPFRH